MKWIPFIDIFYILYKIELYILFNNTQLLGIDKIDNEKEYILAIIYTYIKINKLLSN